MSHFVTFIGRCRTDAKDGIEKFDHKNFPVRQSKIYIVHAIHLRVYVQTRTEKRKRRKKKEEPDGER